jgi:mannan endo-1,4-beta-mannosidase
VSPSAKRAGLAVLATALVVISLGASLFVVRSHTQPASADAASLAASTWANAGVFSSFAATTALAHDGTHALAVGLNATPGGGQIFVNAPSPLRAGMRVSLYVYVPRGTPVSGQFYAQDRTWGWDMLSGWATLVAGRWNFVTGVIPSGVKMPLRHIGFDFVHNSAVAATLVFDQITVGNTVYGFEDGTPQGWMPSAKPTGTMPSTPGAASMSTPGSNALATPAPAVPSGTIYASGTSLMVNGHAIQFTGVNAYELASTWGENGSCGPQIDTPTLDTFFASLRPDSLVRIWARQGSMAINVHSHQLDWAPLDRVFRAAELYHQRLIVSIGDFGGGCDDGHVKDDAWYAGGYTHVYNAGGMTPYSYWDYMQLLVNRYKSSPALGLWEPINEPEAKDCTSGYDASGTCTTPLVCNEAKGAQSMRYFFDHVGAEIKTLDPTHLVESGTVGSGQCGLSGPDYLLVHQSPGIDVASYHDYTSGALPGDQWNGLQVRLTEMKQIGKPLIVGEVGIRAQNSVAGCASLQQRSDAMRAKMAAQLAAGVAAFMPWDWMPTVGSACVYETIAPGDPVLGLLKTYPLLGH